MDMAFESICLDYARMHLAEILNSPAREVGSIWGHADFDVDVAGRLLDDTFFYGECKWRSARIDMGMLRTLKERSEMTSYGSGRPGKQYLLFSRSGSKPEVSDHAGMDASVHLIGPEDLAFQRDMDLVDQPTRSLK